MKTIKQMLQSEEIKAYFKEFRIGLEKESQRILAGGNAAKSQSAIREVDSSWIYDFLRYLSSGRGLSKF